MVGSSDFGGLVVLQYVRGGAIAGGLGGGGQLGRRALGPFSGGDDRGGHACAAQSRGQQEITAIGGVCRFSLLAPFRGGLKFYPAGTDSAPQACKAAPKRAPCRR